MRLFECDRCGAGVSFDATGCPRCDAALGYVPEHLDVEVVTPLDDAAISYSAREVDGPLWRCLNSAWGCNWMLGAGTGDVWCRSCRLTRGRPVETDTAATAAWASTEAAKRQLIHQLDTLSLPVDGRTPSTPHGLAFDLVHVPGQPGVTGHLDGLVTLDLTEADERHRLELRQMLGEPMRTVIGHLRHEIGHYYWDSLVTPDRLPAFRRLFGDERLDYGRALDDYHAARSSDWDATTFLSAYATAHPLEDWAETFAHYLHIQDASATAAAHGIDGVGSQRPARSHDDSSAALVAALDRWQRVANGVNAIATSLGWPPIYPFEPRGLVVDKLSLVHSCVIAATGRDPLDAAPR